MVYSTLESLSYTDLDLERAREDADRWQTQGSAGEWQVEVSAPVESPARKTEEMKPELNTHQSDDVQETTTKSSLHDLADEEEGC